MMDDEAGGGCPFCKADRLGRRIDRIAFHQWTDRGRVVCRLSVPTGICNNCGARVWGGESETLVAQAVKHEYDKLP